MLHLSTNIRGTKRFENEKGKTTKLFDNDDKHFKKFLYRLQVKPCLSPSNKISSHNVL